MIQYRKVLELYFNGSSQRNISTMVGSSRNTVKSIVERVKELGWTELKEEMTDYSLEEALFPEKTSVVKGYFNENWEYVHKELLKKNMTLILLHKEYEGRARTAHKIPYAYRTYCEHYGNYAHKYKLTMPVKRKPGEIMEIDWAGSKLYLTNRETGDKIDVYIFVASLSHSKLSYVEGFLDMKSNNWIRAHIHAFEYFGGVTETLVPDNLKTGVTKNDGPEPILNEAYRELADYYRTVIVPTRVVKPKDKPSVEGSVGLVSRQIIAALRNTQCFYLDELNDLIWKKLNEVNNEPFQKKKGSRHSVFEEEAPYLQPLRYPSFQITDWRIAKVQLNYHIQVDRNYYSVPYEYVQCQVEVRLTENLIEVYFKQSRIASHRRQLHLIGQHSTLIDHMPDHHRLYVEHTPGNAREWAEEIGPYTLAFVEKILIHYVEKQALKVLMTFHNLTKKHPSSLIETSCEILLSITEQPTLSTFKSILKRQTQRHEKNAIATDHLVDDNHGFVRGATYFGGKQ